VVISEHDATIQLQGLISPLIVLPKEWTPFTNEDHDQFIYDWVKHVNNNWCSGKKFDFTVLTTNRDYVVGDYARAVLLVLGVTVK
jgi:hypothetical protein